MLKQCYNKTVANNPNARTSTSTCKDVSFGILNCYIGEFRPSDASALSKQAGVTFKIVSPYYRNNGHGNGPNYYKFPKFTWDNQKHKDNENHKSPKYNKYNEDYKSPKYNKYNEDQKFPKYNEDYKSPKYNKYNEDQKFPKYNDHNNHNNHNNHNDQHNHNGNTRNKPTETSAESSPEDTPAASVDAFRNRRPRPRPNNGATTTIPNNVVTTTNPATTSAPTVPAGSCPNYASEGPSSSAPGNLDCIDQSPSNLDGIYSYPSSAGSGVDVYVVDTGVYSGNQEFGNRVVNGAFYCSGCTSTSDDNGHGTNVAGIILGTNYGVAKQCNIIPVKVCDSSGSCQNSDIISGLSWAASRHSNSAGKKSVINMSLGGGISTALNNAVQSCIDQGMHVAVAAGNDGKDACNYSPSSAPNAIAVGATDNSAAITSFSNYGNCVAMFAPGSGITAAGSTGPSALSTYSGTSQATPHVAGTVALIIADSGNQLPSDMKAYLSNLATQNVVSGNIHNAPNRFLRVPHC
ncbi:peptidase S8/S53 domain-containing protein [Gigaspora rosea]|uniref:Peptidase S8/S53 domain-containing protein n=1 Tax=Gigaspora rosea TaxID=44941 RepID=A0A397TXH8_9GLOM|nr:peptidase S8/S53 domain-containing protein [Gigaspora rosea]